MICLDAVGNSQVAKPLVSQVHFPQATSVLRFLLSFTVFFLLLDILLFRFLLWRLPNETAWETQPFYNFEYQLRRLAREKPEEELRMLILGSSVGLYSVLPRELSTFLNRRFSTDRFQAHPLGRQGLNPLHLLAISDRILEARPDALVLPVNMVDFRLERPAVLGFGEGEVNEGALRRDLLGYHEGEFRLLSPGGTLRSFGGDLDLGEKSATLAALASGAYRYRPVAFAPVGTWLSNRFSRGRSYLHYAGVPVGGGGVNRRGRTGLDFELVLTEALLRTGLEVEAPSQLFAKEKPFLKLLPVSGGTDVPIPGRTLCPTNPDSAQRIELRRGWQNIPVPGAPGDLLCVSVRPGYESEADADTLGVRLARNAGRERPLRSPFVRPYRREDFLYRDYSDEEYLKSFEQRLQRFDRAGMEYLAALEATKKSLARRAFDPRIPTFAALKEFLERVERAGVPLLLVNAPENPVSLALYRDSEWYRGYLSFLRENGTFVDAGDLLPMQDFYDTHHLAWRGAERFTEFLGDALAGWRAFVP